MWAANAATVSPSPDTKEGLLNLTPANLSTMLHRSIEHEQTGRALKAAFPFAAVHDALPMQSVFADEGAANHVRLCAERGGQGLELFVYGREGFVQNEGDTKFCVGAKETLFFHELAFADTAKMKADVAAAAKGIFTPNFVEVPLSQVPIADAIKAYLFNSMLVQFPADDRLTLIAPLETQENDATRQYCETLTAARASQQT